MPILQTAVRPIVRPPRASADLASAKMRDTAYDQRHDKVPDKVHTTVSEEVSSSLLAPQAFISPKYFYNGLGSKLFEAICELAEYYPTRTEASILDEYVTEIAASVGSGATLIDLGAGNCAKAARLIPFLHPAQYVPIDISADHLHEAVSHLQQRFPHLDMMGLDLDFSTSFLLPDNVRQDKRLFFYPGSSIGNFSPLEAISFLRRLRGACKKDGGILIGVDLIKDRTILNAAYDDALGVTAAFNLNVLQHLNQLLDADFDVGSWRHFSHFNEDKSRIEMFLESRKDQVVKWAGGQRHFAKGEHIHTENSYKYTPDIFIDLLGQTGFGEARIWTDQKKWFAVIHACALA